MGGLGEKGIGEPDQTIGAGLQQEAGENDAAGGRRVGVRVGKPGVQREERELDGE